MPDMAGVSCMATWAPPASHQRDDVLPYGTWWWTVWYVMVASGDRNLCDCLCHAPSCRYLVQTRSSTLG